MTTLSNMAKQLGSAGGKKSVQSRFKGKTKDEISESMRMVRFKKRYTPEMIVLMDQMGKESLRALQTAKLD